MASTTIRLALPVSIRSAPAFILGAISSTSRTISGTGTASTTTDSDPISSIEISRWPAPRARLSRTAPARRSERETSPADPFRNARPIMVPTCPAPMIVTRSVVTPRSALLQQRSFARPP
jgi:hypothetical protein